MNKSEVAEVAAAGVSGPTIVGPTALDLQRRAQAETQSRQQRKVQETLGALMMNQIAMGDQLEQAQVEIARLKAQLIAAGINPA